MKKQVCVVFDIGKTNKKYFVFDQQYKILEESSAQFDEINDHDGYHCDDLEKLTAWMKQSLSKILSKEHYLVLAVNFSTYGASFVHLDETGKILTPLYNYLKSFPYDLRQKFFSNKPSVEQFCTETASPDMGLLNSGLQQYWLKYTNPEISKKIVFSLHLPQYCHFLFTQKSYADITSIGCHTALWNFQKNEYHQWVSDEGLLKKQGTIKNTTHVEMALFEGHKINFGIGVHDSSAALVPYLEAFKDPFVLVSTGTWCVSMNPFNDEPLTEAELSNDCLCYMNFKGQPVKSAKIFAGNEHERQTKHLAEYFQKDILFFKDISFDWSIIRALRTRLKQVVPDASTIGLLNDCPFVERNLNQFSSYEEAYHQFMIDLVAQQVASIKLVLGKKGTKKIFVEGGFSKNSLFMNLLNEAFPNIKIHRTSLGQASALGAALLINKSWGGSEINENLLDLT